MRALAVILLAACPCAWGQASTASPASPVDANTATVRSTGTLAPETPITLHEAEELALRNNPRIGAGRLLALASGQVTRQVRSAELPQISSAITAVKAEDGSRVGAGELSSSRLYTHAGVGGSLTQLVTDFGRTSNLVANARLNEKAQQQTALATEQDVLFATDQAFFRLLQSQSLLETARATVAARDTTASLISALTKSGLKSELDLNIASADLSQAQLMQLDAESDVSTASALLAALLAAPAGTTYQAQQSDSTLPPPPGDSKPLLVEAQASRPDLLAAQTTAKAYEKLARAQELQHLPVITALAIGGVTPVRPDGVFDENWYAAGGVNLELPLFTGFRIDAQSKEAKLRQLAAEKEAADLSNSITRDVQTALLTAQTAYRRIAVTDAYKAEADRALDLAQTRYKLGLSSIVELSQSQLQSTQAAVASVNARFTYLLALRSLDYAQGSLHP